MNRHLLLLLSLLPWIFMAFHPGSIESVSPSLQASVSSQDDRLAPFQLFLREEGARVYLSWFALNSSEVSHYLVERKDPNSDFYVIGGLNAAASDDRFEFEDMMERHSEGPFYYRVKAFFTDQSFTYSKVKEYAPPVLSRLHTSSTGESGLVNFKVGEYVDQGILSVTNMSGLVIHQQDWNGYEGQISMNSFPSGMYILEVTSGNKSWQAQVVAK